MKGLSGLKMFTSHQMSDYEKKCIREKWVEGERISHERKNCMNLETKQLFDCKGKFWE